jgi:aryl-alcohol dehydrogenase-like predicted oxidoreductase
MYNLAKRQAEVELLPMAQSLGIGVIPYSPLGGGLLSGKYGVGRVPEAGRLLSNPMYKVRYGDPRVFEIADGLAKFAAELGVAPAALAVAWVASHPGVTSVLLGARSVAQLDASLGAADHSLDAPTRARISALSPEPPPATDRNEERSEHNFGAR